MTLPSWEERPAELANLLNPVFCALLLQDAAHGYPVGGKIDQLAHPAFQAPRALKEKQGKESVRNNQDQIEVSTVKETINQKDKNDEIYDDSRGDVAISKLHPGQTFSAPVIFRHCAQNDAPPEVSVNLDIPFLPAGIDGIAPVFVIKQCENFA